MPGDRRQGRDVAYKYKPSFRQLTPAAALAALGKTPTVTYSGYCNHVFKSRMGRTTCRYPPRSSLNSCEPQTRLITGLRWKSARSLHRAVVAISEMRQQATVPDCSTEQVSGISFPALATADEGHTGDQIKTALLDAANIIRTLANLPGDDNATSAGGGGRRKRFAHRKFVRGSTVCHLDRQAPRVLEMPRQPIRNGFDHIQRSMFGHSYSSQRSFPERRRRSPLACL